MSLRIVCLLLLMIVLVPTGWGEPGPAAAPDQVLVEFRSSGAAARTKAAQLIGGQVKRLIARGKYAVLETPGLHPIKAARELSRLPEVVAASPNYFRQLVGTVPNDPNFASHQWHLHNTGQTIPFPVLPGAGIPDADIDAPEAWDLTTGSQSVVVAVIDSGIALANASLSPNFWVNDSEVPADGLDNDGNGYADDVNGYNFADQTPDPNDTNGHGSFCAGIVGARGNDGIGTTGVNWQVSLMALKCFGASGSATDAQLVEAIEYAADNGARVINASWGDYAWSQVLENAIRSAGDRGVLFIAASGNDGSNLKELTFYPAGFTLPNLLCVGSTNVTDSWSAFSNFDEALVDLLAPGELVYSTRPTSNVFGNGTSYSAPHVAGAAALLLSRDPAATPQVLRTRLIASAEKRTSLRGRSNTGGRLSAGRALVLPESDSTPPSVVADLDAAQSATNGFRVTWTAPGDDGNSGTASVYDMRISTAPLTLSNFLFASRVPHLAVPSAAGALERLYVSQLAPATTYYFRLLASDDAGNTTPLSNELIVTTADRTVLFSDDMEAGNTKWAVTGSFARTTETAAAGFWSWTDSPGGNYQPNTSASLTSLPFSLAGTTNPWLRFSHQHIFDNSSTVVTDSGEVQMTTDSVNFTRLTRFVDFATPWRPAIIDLQEYAGASAVQLRFLFQADGSNEADGWSLDDVEVFQPVSLVPEPADFVVESWTPFDVNQPPSYEENSSGGAWLSAASKAVDPLLRAHRSRYNDTDTGPLASTAGFTPLFSVGGEYEVFAIWPSTANAENVRYRIAHQNGTSDVFLTQDGATSGSQWISLGTYFFPRGRNLAAGSVMVDESTVTGKPNTALQGNIAADAIRFVYRPGQLTQARDWEQYGF